MDLDIELFSNDFVPQWEIIVNGAVSNTIQVDHPARRRVQTRIELPRSGWFLVRGLADVPETFRFASTGPFYVEIGDSPRHISRKSVEFFSEWLDDRQRRVSRALTDETELSGTLPHYEAARQFWQARLAQANAE